MEKEMFSKPKDIFFSNFSKICRTCIKTVDEPLHQIFESDVLILNENIKTSEVLLAVSTLKMEPEDDLPKGICIQCLDSLTKAYNFQKMCILSDLCMRSAILPSGLQIISKTVAQVESVNIKALETGFLDVMPPSVNETNVNILLTEQIPAINKSISNLYQASGLESCIQSALISNNENSGIQILLVESLPNIGGLEHHLNETGITESAVIIPVENESNFNIFPAGKAIISEPLVQSNVFPIEPHISYRNLPTENSMPWKKNSKLQTVQTMDIDPGVRDGVIVPSENQSSIINTVTSELLPTSYNDASEKASNTEPCQQYAKILNKKKRNVRILSIESLPTVSDPVAHFKETVGSKSSSKSSKNVKKTNILNKKKCIVRILSIESLPTVSDPINHFKETVGSKQIKKSSKNVKKTKVITNKLQEGDIDKSGEKIVVKTTELTCQNDESKVLIDADELLGANFGECQVVKKKQCKDKNPKNLEEFNKTTLDHKNIEDEEKTNVENESVEEEIEKPPTRYKTSPRFTCEICGMSFHRQDRLKRHLYKKEGQKVESLKIVSKLEDNLRTHSVKLPFLCADCGKAFSDPSNLRQHELRHTGVKNFQCPECPSKFTCRSNLLTHKNTHRNKKPFVCDVCDSGFTTKYSMKKHKLIHTGEKPHKCDQCEKRFNTLDHMKRHKRTHTGDKPYACKYCEKKFAQSNDMIAHLRTHVGEKVYRCEECGASFRLNTELKKHVADHYKLKRKNSQKNTSKTKNCSKTKNS